ncbi:type IV pilin protein [Microbulbifer bruguierae]|uniref:Type IV pilin protein n=1 Tax=Microbulbifer bruguierae TaxID=3029061 RepID=A0ABY8NIA0_9GAMM|nr:type IV pilin protein [Microbulbifer bruguierae]WGL18185.1 type IV pilin protein [Microbulbifer bruguierae]
MKRMTYQQGFTLIELIIVVAIIGVIAGIAYPSYMDSVRKSNRSDAKASLHDVAQRLQRCFTVYNAYNSEDCSVAESLKDDGVISSGEGLYDITAALATTTYRLTATPVVGGIQDSDNRCRTLTLNQAGVRNATGADTASCW